MDCLIINIALFHVNELGMKWCKAVRQKPPLPMEQIAEDMD